MGVEHATADGALAAARAWAGAVLRGLGSGLAWDLANHAVGDRGAPFEVRAGFYAAGAPAALVAARVLPRASGTHLLLGTGAVLGAGISLFVWGREHGGPSTAVLALFLAAPLVAARLLADLFGAHGSMRLAPLRLGDAHAGGAPARCLRMVDQATPRNHCVQPGGDHAHPHQRHAGHGRDAAAPAGGAPRLSWHLVHSPVA